MKRYKNVGMGACGVEYNGENENVGKKWGEKVEKIYR